MKAGFVGAGLVGALLLATLGAASPVAAANGDNLRTFIADRSGTVCASVDAAGNMSGHGFGGNVFALGVGVAFDGTNLLLSCFNDNTVTAVSPANGAQVVIHQIIGASSLGALAWDNGRGLLWACSASSTIGTISLLTNVFVPVFSSGGCFDGLAYDGSDDTIWASADANPTVRHYSTTGTLINTYSVGINNSGIAVGGDLLYLANDGGQQIYTAPKSLSPLTLFASFPRRIEDLECDNLTFAAATKGAIWSVDAYDNILNAWEIPFGSCLFGGGGGNITLTPADATNPVGTDHTVTAHVTDSTGAPLVGQVVTFVVTGQNAGATGTCAPPTCASDASGDVTFTYHDTNGAGDDTITASFTDSAGHLQSATATKHWLGDQAIAASGVPIAATEGTLFDGTVATFTDPDASATAGEYSAAIDWGDTTSSAGTVTGSGGSFTVSGSHVYAEEGSYPVTVTITDTDNAANSATATSTATVADAALSSTCAVPAFTAQAYAGPTATFTDASSTGTLSDFTATIDWGDTTNSAGAIAGGPGNVPYTVSGSHTYSSTGPFTVTTTITDVGTSTTTATCSNVVVFAFAPGGGSFAIGDKESADGTSVLFWGAQWAKNNPVSSGTSVSAFKGFALNPATPTCRVSWSTDPGNSTPPPAGPLPAYMGVIVTSSYSKSGSTISGDIVHIVVVRTNPGYAPNPGHAGTGTVVGQVC
jgi:hypothetical protein